MIALSAKKRAAAGISSIVQVYSNPARCSTNRRTGEVARPNDGKYWLPIWEDVGEAMLVPFTLASTIPRIASYVTFSSFTRTAVVKSVKGSQVDW